MLMNNFVRACFKNKVIFLRVVSVLQGLQPLPVLARAAIKGVSEDCAGSCGQSVNSLRPASTFERAERQTDGANQYRSSQFSPKTSIICHAT